MTYGDLTAEQRDIYDAVLDPLAERYGEHALKLLERIRDICREAGLATDEKPVDTSADDYQWSMLVWRTPEPGSNESSIDITLEISEAQVYGDSEEHPFGINFALRLTGYGGRIVGELVPYNYTAQCWVDARDPDAVQARWEILEQADLNTIPELIGE